MSYVVVLTLFNDLRWEVIEKNWQIILQIAPKIKQLHDQIIFNFKYKFTISLI
jgi:hypothetical protein